MTLSCFHNRLEIGPQTQFFTDTAPRTIATGLYHWDEFRTAFLAAWTTAGKRFGLTSAGFVTLDNGGGAVFAITWTSPKLRDLLGYTADLGGANTYTASRKIRGAWHPMKPVNSAIAKPRFASVNQEETLSGKRRTFYSGAKYQRAQFAVHYVDGLTELASPAGYCGTGYSGLGLTDYTHARDNWWDTSDAASQGWANGRPVRFFADRDDADIAAGLAANYTFVAANYSTWNFDAKACADWSEIAKERTPLRTTLYMLEWDAQQEVP